MDKKELRSRMILRRDNLTEKEREIKSQLIMEKILDWDAFQKAQKILSYCSFRSEVNTEEINQRILEEGKELYLPKTYPKWHEMKFYRVMDIHDLVCGYQGIPEPREGKALFESDDIGTEEGVVMLMPGVAYDRMGNRLGYGGGYYDRYLAKHEEKIEITCMLAFDVQQAEKIETKSCDIRPRRIITDRR